METANSKTAPKNPKDTEDETPPTEDEYENDRYEQAEEQKDEQETEHENREIKKQMKIADSSWIVKFETGEVQLRPVANYERILMQQS